MHIVNKRDFLASIVLLLAMLGFYVESTRIETHGCHALPYAGY